MDATSVTGLPAGDRTFVAASRLVLDYLKANVPLALWSVTRVENGQQTFLFLDEGNGYGMVPGDGHAWSDSFCIHMAAGEGPAVAPDAQAVPVYAQAGVNATAVIGAYAGAVVTDADGQLFGAICGLDPQRQLDHSALAQAAPLLHLLGNVLSVSLASDRTRDRLSDALAEVTSLADTDPLTGLANRRAWELAVAEEEARFARYADPTVAVMMDLDRLKEVNDTQGHAAGDAYIAASALALRASVKRDDIVARLGGDEFGVLLRNCTEEQAVEITGRLLEQLEQAGVSGSVGWAPLTVLQGFPHALAQAEARMYEMKRARRVGRQ